MYLVGIEKQVMPVTMALPGTYPVIPYSFSIATQPGKYHTQSVLVPIKTHDYAPGRYRETGP